MSVDSKPVPIPRGIGPAFPVNVDPFGRLHLPAARPLLHRIVEACLHKTDGIFDAAATILALSVVGEVGPGVAAIVVATHVLLSLRNHQPMPFRLDQYFPWSSVASPVLIAVVALVAVTGWAPRAAVVAALATTAFCISGRIGYVALVRAARRRRILREPALIVGTRLERLALREACDRHPEYGLHVVAEIGSSELHAALEQTAIDPQASSGATALVVARGMPLTQELLGELRWAVTRGYRVLLETRHSDREVPAGEVVHLASARIVSLPSAPLNYRSWLIKRAFDLTVSTVLLFVLAPVMVAISSGVKLTSAGPIIFRQPRIGRDGRVFTMFKFRTFPVDHVDDQLSLDHGDCPLAFGRFLRRTSLDELPQLVNVLRGEMSVVGPRPERPHFVEGLTTEVPGYHERHRVPGGITGLAQVKGFWGNTSIAERVNYDNFYIDSWRLHHDFSILVRTVPAVIRKGRG